MMHKFALTAGIPHRINGKWPILGFHWGFIQPGEFWLRIFLIWLRVDICLGKHWPSVDVREHWKQFKGAQKLYKKTDGFGFDYLGRREYYERQLKSC
jgi:hypothetical protein